MRGFEQRFITHVPLKRSGMTCVIQGIIQFYLPPNTSIHCPGREMCRLTSQWAVMLCGQGLNWGIPPDHSSPTSAFRSAICNMGSTTLKYRSDTFLLGSTTVKHGILTVPWIQCQCSTAGRDHLVVACAAGL